MGSPIQSPASTKAVSGLAQASLHVPPPRRTSHSDVSLRPGQSTRRLEVPQEVLQLGRKRSGTHVLHGQQLAKRSREYLRVEELPALKTEAQLLRIEQQTDAEVYIEVDSGEEPEEGYDLETLRRAWKANRDYKTLERRRNYLEKSIAFNVEGAMSETVRAGLATLPRLDSLVLQGGLEGELGSIASVPVETREENLLRVKDWVKGNGCSDGDWPVMQESV